MRKHNVRPNPDINDISSGLKISVGHQRLSRVKFNTPGVIWSSNGRPARHKILVSFWYFPVLVVVCSYVRHVGQIKSQVQDTSLLKV